MADLGDHDAAISAFTMAGMRNPAHLTGIPLEMRPLPRPNARGAALEGKGLAAKLEHKEDR